MNGFRHHIPIQIRFSDIDRLNHVNNACYLTYFELGRVRYFDQVLHRNVDWNKTGFILARTEVDYISPLHLRDEVECHTCVEKVGNKSMRMRHVIIRKENGADIICASSVFVLVAMDYSTRQSVQVPSIWRELISEFENFTSTDQGAPSADGDPK